MYIYVDALLPRYMTGSLITNLSLTAMYYNCDGDIDNSRDTVISFICFYLYFDMSTMIIMINMIIITIFIIIIIIIIIDINIIIIIRQKCN